MYKSILLALDLACDNQELLERAEHLSKTYNAQLSIAHVVEPFPSIYAVGEISSPQDTFQLMLDRSREALVSHAATLNIPVNNAFLEVGQITDKILKLATKLEADLIVTGSHGRHGLNAIFGSTASAIIKHANCDVLSVHLKRGT